MLKPSLFALFPAVTPIFAQDFLDPLIVTASRSGQPESRAPYTVHVLDSQFIRENTRRTVPEALQYTPGVLVQKTAHGHGSPYIRGFTGRQNLLLFDGIRVNNSTYRSGPIQYWNTIDPLSLDRIELIKSQGSVLYGSDAAGGTLNAFGKSSSFLDRPDGQSFAGGAAAYEFRSNGQGSHIGRMEIDAGIGGKFGVMLGFSAKDFGDIETRDVGRMIGTGHPEENLDLRLDWAVAPGASLTLAHYEVHQDDISRWHRTNRNPGWTNGSHVTTPGLWEANTYDQERSLTYLRYAGESAEKDAPVERWNASLSYQSTRDSEFQNRMGDPAAGTRPIRGSFIDVDTLGFDLSLESTVGPGLLVYGLDFYHDEVDSSGYQTNLADSNRRESLPVADDSEYDLFGAFAQYLWKPVDCLEITAGARHTRAEATLGRFVDSTGATLIDQSENWDSTVGSLRGIYLFHPEWSLFGGISQAFRAPNLDDLTGNLTSRSGTTNLGTTDLDPEKYITYELGVRHQTDTASLNLSVYYADVDGLITSTFTDATLATAVAANAADGYNYGVELEGAWRFHPQWTLSGFAGWQEGRTTTETFLGSGVSEDRPNSRQLPLTGSLALRWTDESGKLWVEGRVLAAAREDRITAADQAADRQRIPTGGTPGYVVASLHAGWQVNDHLALNCGVENLTDEDYRNHGSGQNEPGLNGVFRVRVTW